MAPSKGPSSTHVLLSELQTYKELCQDCVLWRKLPFLSWSKIVKKVREYDWDSDQTWFTTEAWEQAQKDYRQAFSKALKDKHNETLLAAKAAGDHTGNIIDVHGLRIESSLSNNFSNFQRFVDTQGEEMRIEANMTLDQVRSKSVGFIFLFSLSSLVQLCGSVGCA